MTVSTLDKLDAGRQRLLELVEARGENLTSLSRQIGRNPGYLRDYVRKLSPTKLDEDERAKLAAILGCNPAELKGSPEPGPSPVAVASPRSFASLSSLSGAPVLLSGPRDLKILGHVRGGSQGFFIDNGEVQGYTVRPEILAGVTDAYAVYVHDDSMAPAFEPGHLVWVDPSRPVKADDDVVIQLTDGQAFIKRLKRRTERVLVCQQWNPPDKLEYASAKVKAVHLVVGSLRVRT